MAECECRNTAAARARNYRAGFGHAGVAWHEELSGPNGMDFFLMPDPEATPDQVKECKRYLRESRDVTGIWVWKPCPHEDAAPPTVEALAAAQPSHWIDEARKVKASGTAGYFGGMVLDLFTAGALVSVYDALNETNRAKFQAMGLARAADVAFSVLGRASA